MSSSSSTFECKNGISLKREEVTQLENWNPQSLNSIPLMQAISLNPSISNPPSTKEEKNESLFLSPLQEIHSLPTKITDGLNYVDNYRRNIDGTKHIIFSTFLLQFTDRIPTKNYRRKCSVGNFRAICRRQLLSTIY